MDSKPPQNPPRKLKFQPKAPPRRAPAPIPVVKSEKVEDVDSIQAKNLLKQFQERSMRGKPKIEKKGVQTAFGFGSASTKLKSYGVSIGRNTTDQNQGLASNGGAFSLGFREKEYTEPWDYYSYYPVTLPLRRPYAGNPALLDVEEFGEASETVNSVEDSINPSVDLGLMEENVEATMFLLHLPPTLPMIKRSVTADDHEMKENSRPPKKHAVEKTCKLEELPAGHMGKMLVYRSGAVKFKLGETIFDVSPGMDYVFAEDVVAVNTAAKHCSVVSEIDKHATISPDVFAIIDNMDDSNL